MFGGELLIKHECLKCKTSSAKTEHFFDLQLTFSALPVSSSTTMVASLQPPLIDGMNNTTQSLLSSFFASQRMTENDRLQCDNCNALCDGERQITLKKGPSNLILLLKHFEYDRCSGVRQKLLHNVHHDEEITLMAQTKDGDIVQLKYKLYATIVHSGKRIDSGHYYTYAMNTSDEWFKFNDEHVSPSSFININDVSTINTPYILFYKLVEKDQQAGDKNANVSNKFISCNYIVQQLLFFF